MTSLHAGWYLVAYEDEIPPGVAPLDLGGRRLMTLREADRVRVFDADCPHRGAHLGYGGSIVGGCVECPFHGRRIALGDLTKRYAVVEHRAHLLSGMLFVRLTGEQEADLGFEEVILGYAEQRAFVPMVNEHLATSTRMIMENAFDCEHFTALHRMPGFSQFASVASNTGEIAVAAKFGARIAGEFYARAFSPTLVVTELRMPERTQVIITGTVPEAGGSRMRIGFAVPPEDAVLVPEWNRMTHIGFEQDRMVWDHIDESAPQDLSEADSFVQEFWHFCEKFPTVDGGGG
jgi:3-ketosteroid 9alpha-monooxygenase subunit A